MRVLLTGASRGIGHALASVLLDRNAQLAVGVRDVSAASVTALLARGARAALPVDLRDSGQTESLVDRAVAALGGLDVLINCAGIVHYAAIAELTAASVAEQFQVNCLAPVEIARRAGLQMSAQGSGVIVNVASTLGLKPAPLTAAYSASKAALISFTRSLALELGPRGVRVNAVAPGVIDTDMVRVERPASTPDAAPLSVDAQLEVLRQLHLVGRLGTPAEVAQAVLYLLDAPFVTGSVLVIDGGLSLI